MDKETYKALKRLIFTLHNTPVKGINGIDFVKVRDWIDEVAKEYEECANKDANGNACWNCESGMGECGTAEEK